MVNLDWCKKQEKGIKLIEPNDNLSKEYLSNAEETLDVLKRLKGKSNMWLATSKYYFEYFCVYSIFMKLGIKCEIHDCTIELCRLLSSLEIIPVDFYKLLKKDKELRIDNQYYLKNKKVEIDFEELTTFLLKTKDILIKLSLDKIKEVREKIKNEN